MSGHFFDGDFYDQGTECQFEPDALPILCIDCDKPTDDKGTCTDRGMCSECRKKYSDVGIDDSDVAIMMVGVVSGEYNYKPTKRLLHLAGHDGKPICRQYKNPQPTTKSKDETNCKKCVSKIGNLK